ncbi:MAG: hypothetical protein ACREBS_02645 [Nitrososphaerales archaeon]
MSGSVRKKRREAHIVARVARQIASNPSLSKIASLAVKDEVDYIYGYKKYSLDEIASELEERLYNPTYLGRAVIAILQRPEVSKVEKTHLAENYLDVVVTYLKGKMPRKTYEYWGSDAEPSYVVESAAYLVAQGKNHLDWITKPGYLKGILSFTKDSSVQAKKSLLEGLVAKINEEYGKDSGRGRGRNLLTDLLSKEDLIVDNWVGFLKEMGVTAPVKDNRGKFQLVGNLGPLLDAEGNESSAGALCRLSCFETIDLTAIFAELSLVPFLRRTPSNRTLLYYDGARVMCQERNVPFSSIVQALARKLRDELKKDRRVMYYADEPRLKALCRFAVEIGESRNTELLVLVKNVINLKGVETETRLVLFRFLYENLDNEKEKRSLLETANSFKSGKIKAWAGSELNAMRKKQPIMEAGRL